MSRSHTRSGLAEVSESTSHAWPNVCRGNEVVWHSATHTWRLAVDKIILGEELHCSFSMREQNCSFSVGLGTQSQYVEVGHQLLSTHEVGTESTFVLSLFFLWQQELKAWGMTSRDRARFLQEAATLQERPNTLNTNLS